MAAEFTFTDLLWNSLERDADAVAVVDGPTEYTYAELARQSISFGAALIDAGVGKGDRVGIYMEKSWESIVAMLAISQAGAAFVNLNPLLRPAQASYIIEDCGIHILIADTAKLAGMPQGTSERTFYKGEAPSGSPDATAISAVLDRPDASIERTSIETDLATILYTSGSTGMPKGVALSQRNLVVGAQIVSTYLENSSSDRILSVLPFSFDVGLNQFTTALRVGATLIIQHSRLPGDLVHGIRRHEATGLAGVPPVWSLMLRSARLLEEQPPDSLRYITNTGGRIPQANVDELRRLLPHTKIYLMYGLTEAFRSTYLPPAEIDRGSSCIGKAIPNTEILVIKDGRECGPGEVGELVHRGPTVAMGYWGKEEATREKYRPHPLAPPELHDVERVVYSGDLVKRDEEGFLYFVGRDDAMIKSQGNRMSPEEIENLLIASGLVREACAFGEADEEMGQRIVAVVSLNGGGTEQTVQSIRQYAMKNAPAYMVPSRIVVLDELPMTPSGKIDRPTVRDAYADG